MYKSNIEICLVITNEIASKIKEALTNGITGAGYKLNHHESIEEFLTFYEEQHLEVCMITNESIKSGAYKQLKEQYRDLKDYILVEPNVDMDVVGERTIYIDSENGEIDIESLLRFVDSTVEQLEIAMYGGVPEEDVENNEYETDLPIESSLDDDEDDDDKVLSAPPVEENVHKDDKVNEPKESKDDDGPADEDFDYELPEPKSVKEKETPEIEKKEPVADAAPEAEVVTSFQNNPFPMRLRNIQKSLSGPKMDKYKTIGVWSPLPAIGVTSFLINFSLFLSENKVHTAVLESLTSNHILKDWLKRYSPIPERWVSLASNLHASEPVGDSEWLYRGVKFFPLSKDDVKQDWNSDSFGAYHRMTEIYDVTLIDMPTGEMDVFTKESLEYMDELWIVVDDRVQQLNSWKDYIKKIKDTHNISIYLIHNKVIAASKPNVLSEGIGVPMLATIPALWEETAKNYYQNKPLYLQKDVQPKLQTHYHQLATHLIGPSFQLQDKKPTMWEQIAKIGKFQNILNG